MHHPVVAKTVSNTNFRLRENSSDERSQKDILVWWWLRKLFGGTVFQTLGAWLFSSCRLPQSLLLFALVLVIGIMVYFWLHNKHSDTCRSDLFVPENDNAILTNFMTNLRRPDYILNIYSSAIALVARFWLSICGIVFLFIEFFV